ncbi:MAG: serine hydrolase domain-containing protein, partial [Syntrophothermus sp.]
MYIRQLHNSKSNFILLLFALLIFTSNLYSQELSQKFSAYLTEYYAVNEVPSVTAGIAVNNKILWMDSRGYADIEHQTKSSTSTIYRIASISKSITAVAVMQLVEKGLINLDDDALLYIPYFTHKKYKFTIRQLLSHTSGIRGYRDGEFDSKDFYPTIKDAVLKLNNDPLEYEPGTKYLYSSLAYNLLAAIIENVTRQSFVDYVTYNIFVPAGMNSTFADAQKSLIFNRARGYEKNIKREFENAALADLSIKIPGGGFISTVEDLLRFGMALMHGTLIKKSTLDKILEPTILKNGEIKKYGLGFAIEKDEEGKTFFCHYGGGTGFVSQFLFYPNENIAAVHLINVKNGIFE